MQVAKNREIVTNNEEILYTGYNNYAREYNSIIETALIHFKD